MQKATGDCLELILEKLSDDKKSLHTCLFINKQFCKLAAPILWRDPWALFLNDVKLLEKAKLFFNTVLLQLPEESRKLMEAEGINLPQRRKPTFDYVSFCKYIRHTYSSDGKKDDDDIYEYVFGDRLIMKREIYKLFISKCSALKFIDITNIDYPLYEYPGARNSLTELNQLCCGGKNFQLLSGLVQHCRSLEKIHVKLTNPSTELARLISVQQILKSIIIKDNNNEGNLDKQYEIVGQAIIKHANSINYLNLTVENVIVFYNQLLSKLVNIQKLVLYDSRYRNVAIHKQLIFPVYPKLQVLQIGISFSVATKIIQESKENIKAIWMDKGNQESEDQIGQLIQVISNCSKLKYLKIYLRDENLTAFEQVLKKCKLLKGLYIYRGNIYKDDEGKKLLDKLIQYAPKNLCEFQLRYCYFKIETLVSFFNEWRGKSLRLYPILVDFYEDKHLSKQAFDNNQNRFGKIVEKYKREGAIEMFESSADFMFINFAEFDF